MELEFERQAMRGEEMPNGLDFTSQKMYQALSWLYKRYYSGQIDRAQAKLEKDKLIYQYNREKAKRKFEFSLCCKQQEMFKRCEIAASNYAKQRTLKNADALYEAIYGLPITKEEVNEKQT